MEDDADATPGRALEDPVELPHEKPPEISLAVPGFVGVALANKVVSGAGRLPLVVCMGDEVDISGGGFRSDDFAIIETSGVGVPCVLVAAASVEVFCDAIAKEWDKKRSDVFPVVKDVAVDDSESDVRTLACRFEPDGERSRGFSTSITMMAEEEFPFLEMPTNVPRATPWFLRDSKRPGPPKSAPQHVGFGTFHLHS